MKQVPFMIYFYIKEQSESRTQQRHGIYMTKETIFFHYRQFSIFLDGEVPSHGAYICQLVRCARICNNVSEFNDRNFIDQNVLHQG